MLDRIAIPQDEIASFCRRWGITEFALFGSVLRDDFTPESDIDVLVTFRLDVKYGFADLAAMEQELETIFGRSVDLGTRRSVEEDPNYLRRRAILDSTQVIYAE
jgi:predicted nucleotidyltransferase